jgi:hypothetical protein
MAIWEYAFLHQFIVHTSFDRDTGVTGRSFKAYVVEDLEGVRILEGIDSTLAALNSLGADGWLVQLPASWQSSRQDPAGQLIASTTEKANVSGGLGFYMRRPRDPETS